MNYIVILQLLRRLNIILSVSSYCIVGEESASETCLKGRTNQVSDSVMDLLLKLDSRVQPGIPIADFAKLFRRCPQCKMIMTRRVTRQHRCLVPAIIDLTVDKDEASCSAVIDLT